MRTTNADPIEHLEAVTLSDTVDIAMGVCRGFIPTDDGEVKVTTKSGAEIPLTVLGGVLYPIQCKRFWSTGTTVSGITAGN